MTVLSDLKAKAEDQDRSINDLNSALYEIKNWKEE